MKHFTSYLVKIKLYEEQNKPTENGDDKRFMDG